MNVRLPVCLLIAAGVAVPAAPLLAAEAAHGPYGHIAGGGNYQRGQAFGDSENAVDFEEGGLGAFGLGYATGLGWRPELELAFRRNAAENGGGAEEARTGMANLWYDFGAPGFAPRLRPYLGAGAGQAELRLEQVIDSTGAARTAEDNVFAYQAGAGVNFDASRKMVVSLGYRFLESDTMAVAGTPGSGGLTPTPGTPPIDERYRSDGVLAGLRYVFGGRERSPMAAAPAPQAEPAEVAAFETVVLRPVNFQHDRADLTEPSRQTLDELAARLKSQPGMQVLIEGYADETGTEQYNLRLGQRRAETVRAYLVGKGVKPDALQVASRGESEPVADNASVEGRAQNRRTEVNATEQGERVKIVIEGPTPESVEAAKEHPGH